VSPTSRVFSQVAFDGPMLDAVDAVLFQIADSLERTRKGRVWTAFFGDIPIDIQAQRTVDCWDELESDLDIWEIAPDDWPTTIRLSARTNAEEGYRAIRLLNQELCRALNGVATEPSA
jgi:hypothetical protein